VSTVEALVENAYIYLDYYTDPKGTVEEVVTDGQAEATTKKGNTLKKSGDEENPAVVIKAKTGNQAIKKASEIDGVN
jgi:hypothetical protein